MNKFIMMIGLPGSGKSYKAKEIALKENAIVISSDELRKELLQDEDNQDFNNDIFKEAYNRIKNNLKNNMNVIFDATNISYKKRKTLLEELKRIKCYKECYFIATPYYKCLKQNARRDRNVPTHVIRRMYKSIYIPQYYEGWDKINIINNFDKNDYALYDLFYNKENGLNYINQENPHHTLTIGNHCLKCYENIDSLNLKDNKRKTILGIAALLHDIGKNFTKEFKNYKGEVTDIAHYYNHENISAYKSLIYCSFLNIDDKLRLANYIQWHMKPFFLKTQKAKDKFIKLVGEDIYMDLLILNQADINAK